MIIKSEHFKDNRGTLLFPVRNKNFIFQESTVSINNKGTFRGIHLEQFDKLITCVYGKILDIIINFNKDDDDYLIPKYYTLNPSTDTFSVMVQKNYGHAFLSLEDHSTIVYYYSESFNPSKTRKINFRDPVFNIHLPIDDPIISDDDLNAPFFNPIECIIFGSSGFIGSIVSTEIKKQFLTHCSTNRLENIEAIKKEIILYKPLYVINCAGISTPISWCENHKIETIQTNIVYQLTLADICRNNNIHLTIIGSGVIFQNNKEYSEEDQGNFFGNFYSQCRIYLENMLRHYPNILYLRVNYPISSIPSNKNLLTKILSFSTIHNRRFSITYIDQLASLLPRMLQNNECGICNFVNSGTLSMKNILDVYNIYATNTCHYSIQDSYNDDKSYSCLSVGILKKYGDFPADNAVQTCILNYLSLPAS